MARLRRRRGYPLAQLLGLEEGRARLWSIYSQSVKPNSEVQNAQQHSLFESIVEALRPGIIHGVTSILIATSDEKKYSSFIDYLRRHHGWLLGSNSASRTAFARIGKLATSQEQVRDLVKSQEFRKKLEALLEDDQRHIIALLDRRLSSPHGIETLLFSLEDVEDAVYTGSRRVECVLVAERFRDDNRARIDRLLQIMNNRNMKTKVVGNDTTAEKRISQFGGLLCMLEE